MTFVRIYTFFERAVAALLTAGMAVVIVLSVWSFLRSTLTLAFDTGDPLDFASFQTLFDRVLAAVIALELAHSVQQMVVGKHGLTQVKTVIIIGVLAVVRKLILLEIESTSGLFLVGIAAALVALGATFALVQWIEQNSDTPKLPSPGAEDPKSSG